MNFVDSERLIAYQNVLCDVQKDYMSFLLTDHSYHILEDYLRDKIEQIKSEGL